MKHLAALILNFIGKLVGHADVEKSFRAIMWGACVAILVNISFDLVYFGRIYKGPGGPAANADMDVFLATLVTSFFSMSIGGYVAASLAPANPLRHAAASGIPFYLGAFVGVGLQWGVVAWWHFVSKAAFALLGAIVSGLLYGLLRKGKG